MIQKSIIISFLVLIVSSCASTGGYSNKTNKRTENIKAVETNSAEKINVDLGVGYLKRGKEGDIDVAITKFKKAIKINPTYALAHSMLATVYDKKGLFDSAKIHYKKSIKYNNGNPNIVNNYANFLCQRGSYKEAINKYKEVIDNPKYKTPSSAYENAGVCAINANENKDAQIYFRQALSLNAESANSLYYLLIIHLNKGEYMNARAFLQRLEQVVNPSAEILAAGYEVEKGLNHTKLAKNYLTKLKNRFPRSESLKLIQEREYEFRRK